jgi:hypothetical protein
MNGVPWTAPEDAVLRSLYQTGGIVACMGALPHRTRLSILERALRRLKLASKRRPWTDDEDDRLRLLWGDGGNLTSIAAEIKRPRQGVYRRAQVLGLPLGCPQGHEYLTTAAKRNGFSWSTMRRILAWHGVRLHRALGLGQRSRRPHHVVDVGDVDEAVEAWLATEPVGTAAKRRGLCEHTLRQRLRVTGAVPAKGEKRVSRVTAAQTDAAMALRVVGRRLESRPVDAERLARAAMEEVSQ